MSDLSLLHFSHILTLYNTEDCSDPCAITSLPQSFLSVFSHLIILTELSYIAASLCLGCAGAPLLQGLCYSVGDGGCSPAALRGLLLLWSRK